MALQPQLDPKTVRDLAYAGLPATVVGAGAPPRSPSSVIFPRRYWDSDKRSYLLLIEFFTRSNDWQKIRVEDPPPRDETLREIEALRALIPQREERREEILAQAESVYAYYFARLMMTEKSHPRTFELMNAAIVVGRALIMYEKQRFNRPRPSQLAADLEPMIVVPGHPSYPAGHPFQSRLMSLALAELRPDARVSLLALAERIGENREVAGVHYRSDSVAGHRLAEATFPILRQGPLFDELVREARAEWAEAPAPGSA